MPRHEIVPVQGSNPVLLTTSDVTHITFAVLDGLVHLYFTADEAPPALTDFHLPMPSYKVPNPVFSGYVNMSLADVCLGVSVARVWAVAPALPAKVAVSHA